jgi:hypothetical protein
MFAYDLGFSGLLKGGNSVKNVEEMRIWVAT